MTGDVNARPCEHASWQFPLHVQGPCFWNSCNISYSNKMPLDRAMDMVHSSKSKDQSLAFVNDHWCHPVFSQRQNKMRIWAPYIRTEITTSYLKWLGRRKTHASLYVTINLMHSIHSIKRPCPNKHPLSNSQHAKSLILQGDWCKLIQLWEWMWHDCLGRVETTEKVPELLYSHV